MGVSELVFEKLLGGGIVYHKDDENRLRRRSRREIIAEWKKAAKAIKDINQKVG